MDGNLQDEDSKSSEESSDEDKVDDAREEIKEVENLDV